MASKVRPLKVGDVNRIMSEARRQNGCPTPPVPTTASHWGVPGAGVAKPPGGIWLVVHGRLGLLSDVPVVEIVIGNPAAGFGEVPVVSRRPMSEVTGPNTLTWPIAHSESRSAHGVVHWPTNTLPQPPCRPPAELRDETVTDCVSSRSSGAFCSIWHQAVRPPPRLSLPRTPKFDDGACTSNLLIDGTDNDVTAAPLATFWSRAVKPSPYFTWPNV